MDFRFRIEENLILDSCKINITVVRETRIRAKGIVTRQDGKAGKKAKANEKSKVLQTRCPGGIINPDHTLHPVHLVSIIANQNVNLAI